MPDQNVEWELMRIGSQLFIWSRLPLIQWSVTYFEQLKYVALHDLANKIACYTLYEIPCFRQKTNVVEYYINLLFSLHKFV
jgi:hypothetical protein